MGGIEQAIFCAGIFQDKAYVGIGIVWPSLILTMGNDFVEALSDNVGWLVIDHYDDCFMAVWRANVEVRAVLGELFEAVDLRFGENVGATGEEAEDSNIASCDGETVAYELIRSLVVLVEGMDGGLLDVHELANSRNTGFIQVVVGWLSIYPEGIFIHFYD